MSVRLNECYSIDGLPEAGAENYLVERFAHCTCIIADGNFGAASFISPSARVSAAKYLAVGEVGSVGGCFVVVCGDGSESVFYRERLVEVHWLPLIFLDQGLCARISDPIDNAAVSS